MRVGVAFADGPKGRRLRAFVDTVEDLRRRSTLTATAYDITQAAGLVRRLLIDRSPLAVASATDLDQTLRFEWMNSTNTVGADEPLLIAGAALAPDLESAHPGVTPTAPISEPLEAFLAVPVIERTGFPDCTVADVVRAFSHELGGVHWEMGSDVPELIEFAREREPQHLDWTMNAIARVAHRALEPVANRAAVALMLVYR